MRIRTILLILLAQCIAVCAAGEGLRLAGTFIQYQGWMMDMNANKWRAEIDAMRFARLHWIILQRLGVGDRRFFTDEPGATDPTAVILEHADKHGLAVFIGLLDDPAWWEKAAKSDYLDGLADRNAEFASVLWKRYGKHPSFAGWYIPQEICCSGLSDDLAAKLARYLHAVSAKCKRLAGGKPVAIAPFWSKEAKPSTVRKDLTRLFADAGVDIAMLQDGVGAKGWHEDVERISEFFLAARNACLEAGVRLWSDLECFQLIPADTAQNGGNPREGSPRFAQKPGFVPATAKRIARQLAAAAPFVERFVTFDFFHYMSPHRGAAQARLNIDYLKTCLERPFYPLSGHSTQVSVGFPYYEDRSPESVASELRANGFSSVHFMIPAPSLIDPHWIEAFHREGIGVWWSVFGNAAYTDQDLPDQWHTWEVIRRANLVGKPYQRQAIRFCLSNPEFRMWRKQTIVDTLRKHRFDGVDIMEPYWPAYPGPQSPDYGCFCDACLAAFRRMYPGEETLPDVVDPNSPNAPDNNPELWRKWLQFRKGVLTSFLNHLVNGKGGIRDVAPNAPVCTWSLALAEENGLERVGEIHGANPIEIAGIVKPDVHCLQTHWPDWLKPDLKPDYVRAYQPFVDAIREKTPGLPLMVQADTGSREQNQRDWAWIRKFRRACAQMGVHNTTYYEYFISGYAYTDPPRVAFVRAWPKSIELHFTKRLDPKTAADPENYTLGPGTITDARVDGSVVILTCKDLNPGDRCTLTAARIADAASRRLLKDRPPKILGSQSVRLTVASQ